MNSAVWALCASSKAYVRTRRSAPIEEGRPPCSCVGDEWQAPEAVLEACSEGLREKHLVAVGGGHKQVARGVAVGGQPCDARSRFATAPSMATTPLTARVTTAAEAIARAGKAAISDTPTRAAARRDGQQAIGEPRIVEDCRRHREQSRQHPQRHADQAMARPRQQHRRRCQAPPRARASATAGAVAPSSAESDSMRRASAGDTRVMHEREARRRARCAEARDAGEQQHAAGTTSLLSTRNAEDSRLAVVRHEPAGRLSPREDAERGAGAAEQQRVGEDARRAVRRDRSRVRAARATSWRRSAIVRTIAP